jgi:predicted O-linked N-acetylglucosamine transferase (SPINDLY family)
MHLMAELFEYHDKNKFELIAFSFGPDQQDEWRQRARSSFDQFINVRSNSDIEVASLARELTIDIAVDLKGFTQNQRASIFAHRVAPIQVNYLGYPGTMGAEYMDYIIADPILIPDDKREHYSEKIAYLPNSYQVNVKERLISDKAISRKEFGLSDNAFVFCSFNNNYKITPKTFDCWLRILQAVEGSILWVFKSNETAVKNLKKEAEFRGIDSSRLVFASYLPVEEHLKRIQLADLFLDALPCNAHTTASDALRVGLPVITQMGESFASRVSASLLNAVGLPELVTKTTKEYEFLAIELATNPKHLMEIKDKLVTNLSTCMLYKTKLFTQHIEFAYQEMYKRYQDELAPDHIYVKN